MASRCGVTRTAHSRIRSTNSCCVNINRSGGLRRRRDTRQIRISPYLIIYRQYGITATAAGTCEYAIRRHAVPKEVAGYPGETAADRENTRAKTEGMLTLNR